MNAIRIRGAIAASILVTSLALSPTIAKSLLAADAITEGSARTSSGVKIHYLQSGDATSTRALILIPGWRLPAYLWKEQLTKFAPATRVIAIDPRSQGPSTTAFEGNTPESRASDLHDILAQLKISKVVLVGWSQGAQDVSAYLQQFGDSSVAGIVLVDSPVSAGADELDIHKEFSKVMISTMSLYANHPAEFSQGMVQSLFKKSHPDLDLAKIAKDTRQTPTDVGVAMLVADIFGADRRPALAKFTKPALVIASAESRLLDIQQEMQKTIPNSKMVVVPDANHAVFVDAPEIFDAALKSFLDSLPAW
jgi:non-heme chloroperoxidase